MDMQQSKYYTSNIDVYNEYIYYTTLEDSERIEIEKRIESEYGTDSKMRNILRYGVTFIPNTNKR